jgi:hypothetical protein
LLNCVRLGSIEAIASILIFVALIRNPYKFYAVGSGFQKSGDQISQIFLQYSGFFW